MLVYLITFDLAITQHFINTFKEPADTFVVIIETFRVTTSTFEVIISNAKDFDEALLDFKLDTLSYAMGIKTFASIIVK